MRGTVDCRTVAPPPPRRPWAPRVNTRSGRLLHGCAATPEAPLGAESEHAERSIAARLRRRPRGALGRRARARRALDCCTVAPPPPRRSWAKGANTRSGRLPHGCAAAPEAPLGAESEHAERSTAARLRRRPRGALGRRARARRAVDCRT